MIEKWIRVELTDSSGRCRVLSVRVAISLPPASHLPFREMLTLFAPGPTLIS